MNYDVETRLDSTSVIDVYHVVKTRLDSRGKVCGLSFGSRFWGKIWVQEQVQFSGSD
jgi:hypothetical protein